MKKYPLLIFLFGVQVSFAQHPLVKQWDYRYGGNLIDWLEACIQTSDGGFLVGGWSNSKALGDKTEPNCDPSLNTFDYWFIKAGSDGIFQWDKRFGGTGEDELEVLLEVSGGYLVGGTSWSWANCARSASLTGNNDFWVIKTDTLGNKLWEFDYGGLDQNEMHCAVNTSDGGILLGGISNSGVGGDKTQPNWDTLLSTYDFWIVKINSSGVKLWDKRFGGTDEEMLYSMEQTSDNGFILGGISFSDSSGDKSQPNWNSTLYSPDYWIVKIDSLGNKEWDKRFGGNHIDRLSNVRQTPDGGYILMGSSFSNISGDKTEAPWDSTNSTGDYWIVKTDSAGNKQWDKRLGGTHNEEGTGSTLFPLTGGYIFTGGSASDASGDKTENNNWGGYQYWAIKTDSNGIKEWDKSVQIHGGPERWLSLQSIDNCYVFSMSLSAGIGGEKTQPSWGYDDYWLIKYCDSTLITENNKPVQSGDLMIYPNPTTGKLKIKNEKLKLEIVTVYNLLGETVLAVPLPTPNPPLRTEIDISSLPPGVYILQAGNSEKMWHAKVIKQ
jgi:hypothetical protein